MPHIISNRLGDLSLKLNSGFDIESAFCMWMPNYNRIKYGKIVYKLAFYKDEEHMQLGYSEIYPLDNDGASSKDMLTSFNKQYSQIESSDLDEAVGAGHVSDFLESKFGFWNVIDLSYQTIYDELVSEDGVISYTDIDIDENGDPVEIQVPYGIKYGDYIRGMKIGVDVSGIPDGSPELVFNIKAKESDITISTVTVGENKSVYVSEIFNDRFSSDQTIEITCDDGNGGTDWLGCELSVLIKSGRII